MTSEIHREQKKDSLRSIIDEKYKHYSKKQEDDV